LRPPTLEDVIAQVCQLVSTGRTQDLRLIAFTLMTILAGSRGDEVTALTNQQLFGPGIVWKQQEVPHDAVPILTAAYFKDKANKTDRKYLSFPRAMDPTLDVTLWIGLYLLTAWTANECLVRICDISWLNQPIFPGSNASKAVTKGWVAKELRAIHCLVGVNVEERLQFGRQLNTRILEEAGVDPTVIKLWQNREVSSLKHYSGKQHCTATLALAGARATTPYKLLRSAASVPAYLVDELLAPLGLDRQLAEATGQPHEVVNVAARVAQSIKDIVVATLQALPLIWQLVQHLPICQHRVFKTPVWHEFALTVVALHQPVAVVAPAPTLLPASSAASTPNVTSRQFARELNNLGDWHDSYQFNASVSTVLQLHELWFEPRDGAPPLVTASDEVRRLMVKKNQYESFRRQRFAARWIEQHSREHGVTTLDSAKELERKRLRLKKTLRQLLVDLAAARPLSE
jgi:hypothetical protein